MTSQSSSLSPVPVIETGQRPQHVAVIMDGNGRWARRRGLPRTEGHRRGAAALREMLEGCRELGIHYLTVYAFSSENWRRPPQEISDLMQLLRYYLKRELLKLHEYGVRIKVIGDRELLPEDVQAQLKESEILTRHNVDFCLTVALSYGSRQELVGAMRELAKEVRTRQLDPDAITPEKLASMLQTADLPDPDLLIRTGGEQRLSNFLLWQLAYAELYFTDTLWPDFDRACLKDAIEVFLRRERRYGMAE